VIALAASSFTAARTLAATAWRWMGGDYVRLGIGLAVLVALALTAWRVSAWHSAYQTREATEAASKALSARLKAEERCEVGSKCEARLKGAREAGELAVAKAQATAAEAARAAEAKMAADARAAVERAAEAARAAGVKARAWEARYREATRTDAACKAWSEQESPCPVE